MSIILCWTATGGVFLGWARLLAFASPGRSGRLAGESFWLGFALVIAFLQIWHFWLPVDWRATVVVAGVGVAGWTWALFRDDALRLTAGQTYTFPNNTQRRLFLILGAAIIFWTADESLRAPSVYDSGLYHFQSIRWLNEHPIVPGLGNLHGRLAFNQSYFLFPALLNAAPYFNKGYHLANGLLLVVLTLQLLYRAMTSVGLSLRLFCGLMLMVALKQVERESLSSPGPDLAIFIFGILSMVWFVEFLLAAQQSLPSAWSGCASLAILAALGITFKLSILGFAATMIVLTVWVAVRTAGNRFRERSAASVLYAAFMVLAIDGVWLARGVITSGYPLYPSTVAQATVDWRVPEAKAAHMQALISRWARTSSAKVTDNNVNWLKPWFARTLKSSQVNRPLILLAIAATTLAVFRVRNGPKLGAQLWLPLVAPAAWLVFWFLTAPAPRFAAAALWLIAGWPLALAAVRLAEARQWQSARIMQAMLLLTLALILPGAFRKGMVVMHPAGNGFGNLPQPAVKEYFTATGLRVFVPATGDQAWDAPLPGTPMPDPALELRGRTIADGFRIRPVPYLEDALRQYEIQVQLTSAITAVVDAAAGCR